MKRNLLVTLVLCLLIGAMVNVAFAWWCTLEQFAPAGPRRKPDAQSLWDRYARPEYRNAKATYEEHRSTGAPGVDFLRLVGELPPEDQAALKMYWPPKMLIVRAGFPLRSVESMNEWGPLEPEARWGISIEARNPNIAWVSLLPCRPLWPGFIFNTVFFGGLLFAALTVPWFMVRFYRSELRGRAGLCKACGYPLGASLVCTECGAATTELPKNAVQG